MNKLTLERNEYLKTYDFIFSNRWTHRLRRHVIFWLIFLIYFYYVNLIPSRSEDLKDGRTYFAAFELMIYFPVSIISVYFSIYFILPRYILTGKYLSLLPLVAALTVFYFLIAWLLTMLLASLNRSAPFHQLPVSFRWFQPVRYGIGLPLTSAAITTIIKLLKSWHLKQKENELLQRQKITTELQLLKTQFQPHFLYDALEHIYLLMQKRSAESSATLLKLSDLLSYILYENEKDFVPLEKELVMVRNYLTLKKTFHSERIEIHLEQQVEPSRSQVGPLILVSLVEHCLEQFLKTSLQLILILTIKTTANDLYFQMEFQDSSAKEKNDKTEYDWTQLLRRIAIQYPDRHSFDVDIEASTTNLLLVLRLDEIGLHTGNVKEALF